MSGLSTPLTDVLDIDVPIVQAPVGSATCPSLAAAVADAGALGMLALTWRDEATTRKLLVETANRTDGVFGVNIVVDSNAKGIPTTTHIDSCLDEGIEVFSFSFGEAAPFVDRIHAEGRIVLQSVGSATEAKDAVESGVDIVVAQGREAGGHVQSDVATMPLVPRIADAVSDTPVIAAGGIADGRGIAAALSLGADGAWLGTRFLATEEAHVHRRYRRRVLEASETETIYSTLFDEGWPDVPHRVIENSTVAEWDAAGRPPDERPGEGDIVAESAAGEDVRRYEDSLAVPGMKGNVEALPLYAGQSVGLTQTVQPADELVATLSEETMDALERVDGYRVSVD
ncbi:NAD(P)H-dependent flavin oxidoreductase [Haladaptatus sp. DFWS20]|uniref:NAD(P)H-dependent flavin oxidoreductase n=1 Tax=Haladaptatus sp. DFWS20 TaxID=3403467 RepID=UPI003EBF0B74